MAIPATPKAIQPSGEARNTALRAVCAAVNAPVASVVAPVDKATTFCVTDCLKFAKESAAV